MDNKTLTIVLCQTRESNLTYESLVSKVLLPLESDLAFCGSAGDLLMSQLDPIISNSRYVWNFPEPNNWEEACDAISTDFGAWRDLSRLSPMFLGGTGFENTTGSGLIIMYWREILRKNLTKEILDRYKWFVITRSDFFWKIPHPKIHYLEEDTIYLLDGEKYGGFSDRHIIFHKNHSEKILSFAEPIFNDASSLKDLLSPKKRGLNPEKYLAFIANHYGLTKKIKFLPYLGYTIRSPETKTRWSKGVYSKKHGLFIKYPDELRQTNFNSIYLKSQGDWCKYLDNKGYLRLYVYRSLFYLYKIGSYLSKFTDKAHWYHEGLRNKARKYLKRYL